MKLNGQLMWLMSLGCHPSISRRGGLWRAHVNMAGNYWDEAKTPEIALDMAVALWEKSGRIMDGFACDHKLVLKPEKEKKIKLTKAQKKLYDEIVDDDDSNPWAELLKGEKRVAKRLEALGLIEFDKYDEMVRAIKPRNEL